MPDKVKIFSSIEDAEKALPDKTPRKLILNGQSFCILRINHKIFVMDDTCPHNKASLSGGKVNAFGEIICPLHEYRYELRTGRESSLRCEDLQTYSVTTGDEGIFLLI